MHKKGFTLIELLAVIVILAIIALIATPIILNVIDTARKGAAESSALGYVDAVEKQVMINKVKNEESLLINEGEYTKAELAEKKLNIKGDVTDALVLINNKGKVISGKFCVNDYSIDYDGKKAELSNNDYCEGIENSDSASSTSENNQTTEVPVTHKGIVYLDPTDLNKTCTEAEATANVNEYGTPTEVKTGCMKWYIFDDSGSNYTMILDHNTTARIHWYDSVSYVAYESSNLKPVVDDLVTTSGWKVTPRLITADEVNTITGKTGFDVSSTSSRYYLDTLTQTKATFSETVRSNYDWLYNNLKNCKTDGTDYGCTIEDNNSYNGYGLAKNAGTWGYWTSTPRGDSRQYWIVNRDGILTFSSSYSEYGSNKGIRPVITVPKSIFE